MITNVVAKIGSKVEALAKKVEAAHQGMAANLLKGGMAATIAGGLITGAAIAEGTTLISLAEKTANLGHAQEELSIKFGLGAEQAGLWGAAAEASGVSTDSAAVAFKTLAKNMESLKLLDSAAASKSLMKEQQALATMQLKLSELKKAGNKHLAEEQQKLILNTEAHIKNMQATLATADATRPLQAIFDQLGVQITDQTGKLRPMNDVMMELATSLSKMPDGAEKAALAVKLFGRSGTDLLPLLDQGAVGIQKFMEQAKLSGAVLSDTEVKSAQQAYLANMQFKQALGGVTTQLGMAFLPILSKLLEKMLPVIRGFGEWVKHNQKLIGFLVPIAIVLTALLGIFLTIGGIAMMVVGSFMALSTVGGVLAGVFGAISLGVLPLIAIFAAIVAAAFAVWFAIQHWEDIKRIAGMVWNAITEMVTNVINWLGNLVSSAENLWNQFASRPGYWIGVMVGWIIVKLTQLAIDAWNLAHQIADNVVNWFATLPDRIWTWLLEVLPKVAAWAINMGVQLLIAAKQFGKIIGDELGKLPGQMLDLGKHIVEGIVHGMQNAGGWAKDQVGNFLGGLVDGAKNAAGIHSPSREWANLIGVPIVQGIASGVTRTAPVAHKSILDVINGMMSNTIKAAAKHGAIAGPSIHPSHHTKPVVHHPGPAAAAVTAATAPSAGGGALAGTHVEQLLQQIVDILKSGGISGTGGLSPSQILVAFQHLVEAAQVQRNRGTRGAFVQ